MIPAMRRFFLSLALLPFTGQAADRGPVDYLRDIKPLLRDRCYACHGALKQKAALRLDTGAAIRRGSEDGPVVRPETAAESPLLLRLASADPDERMPPDGDALKPEEISQFRRWIEAGATSPLDEKPEPDPADHWAFKVPVRPTLPTPRGNGPSAPNPIDAFIIGEQGKHGLKPAPPARKEVLLRRVHLNLTGLPPSPEALRAFLADESSEAYATVVDSLLASPQHAQRWAR